MAPSTIKRLFPVIAAAGFSGAVAQIVLLRELLVLFYGIELCLGIILAVWLICSALGCGLPARYLPGTISPASVLIVAAAVLPVTLLLVRASSHLWGIVPGEIPPLAKLLQICLGVTAPFSFLSGLLFGMCWRLSRESGTPPLAIYAGEALGASAGGISFYLLILCGQSALAAVLAASGAMLLAAAWFLKTGGNGGGRPGRYVLPAAACIAVAAGLWFSDALDDATRRIQWGRDLVAAEDTPYRNLVMLRKNRHASVFANGLWLFSDPDPQSREYAVHPALLQHPAPRSVLLLGGGPSGLTPEILRHPGIRRIDVVETDFELAEFARNHFPKDFTGPGEKSGVEWHYRDAVGFLRDEAPRYDVVLMNMGDPVSVQMNRYYTAAFFSGVKDRMAPGGIFSFCVSGGGDMLGEVQIQFLGIIYRTLREVFDHVLVLPGDQVRFLAAGSGTMLAEDPAVLAERLRQRNLHLSHVREDTIRDSFEGFRMRYFKTVLEKTPADQVNSDTTPLCYAYALELWTAQWHSRLGEIVASLTRTPPRILLSLFPMACLLSLLIFKAGRFTADTAIPLSSAAAGGLTMIAQMVLLIEFQITSGALFLHLALIVALFMAGLAGGAGWASLKPPPCRGAVRAKKRLIRVQALMCLLPLALMGLFLLFRGPLRSASGTLLSVFLFPGLSLLGGVLGGFHFSAATAAMAESGHPVSGIGGKLYAFDLAGAAAGLLVATFFLIPSLGSLRLLPLLGIIAATSLATLYTGRHSRP